MAFQYLTPVTMEVLRLIWASSHKPSSDLANKDDRSALIAKIAASEEQAVIPCIFPMLFDSSPAVAQATSDALSSLLTHIPLDDLSSVDRNMRNLSYWLDSKEWRNLGPLQIPQLPETIASKSPVFGLASFHPSGHVREAAVAQLSQINDGSELPFLLLRLNDWVDQVRDLAAQAVHRRLVPECIDAFVRSIPLVIRLNDYTRSKQDGVVSWTFSQLLQPQLQPVLIEWIGHSNPHFRRKCFRHALDASNGQSRELLEVGLASRDSLVRFQAFQNTNPVKYKSEWERLLRLAERDRYMPIRRWALMVKLDRDPENAEVDLIAALMDTHASLRALAQFQSKNKGAESIASFYRQSLAEQKNKAVAIAGLGETGSRHDMVMIRPFLQSRNPKERLAAVRSLVKLAKIDLVDELMALLPDDRPQITRAVKAGLETRINSIDPNRLWALLVNDHRSHVRRAIASLLSKLGTWTGLPFLLRLLHDRDAQIAAIAKRTIRSRFNRVYTNPSSAEKQTLDNAMAGLKLAGDPFFFAELFHWFQSRGVQVEMHLD